MFQDARDTASLSVTFFSPFAGGYHVTALDQRDYDWALVSGPSWDYFRILARRKDDQPRRHDMDSVLAAFHAVEDDRPTCFIAYTIKGFGLPFAGHEDNRAGLINLDQMETFRRSIEVAEGAEWEPFPGLGLPPERLAEFVAGLPLAGSSPRAHDAEPVVVPPNLPVPRGARLSTEEAFGRILGDIAAADGAFAGHIVTTGPDVMVSTNLGLWVNRRGIFDHAERADTFREEQVVSAQRWAISPQG